MELIRKLRTLYKKNENGSTAVEFALVAPVLFLLMMGVTEISIILFAQSVLEGAAFDASRTGKTGYVETNSTRDQTIRDSITRRMPDFFDANNLVFTTTTYDQFDQVGEAEPFTDTNGNGVRDDGENYTDVNGNGQYDEDMGLVGPGNASQVVVYTISYPWNFSTPMISEFFGEDGTYTIASRAVILNEPF